MRCIEYADKLKREGWKVLTLEGNILKLYKNNQITEINLDFDTSTKACGTGIGQSWTSPTNIYASDDAWASYNIGPLTASQPLYAYNFGFTLPNATITNINVRMERHADYSYIVDGGIQIGLYGGSFYTSKADTETRWGNTDVTVSYSYTPVQWGWDGITVEDINNSNFAVKIIAQNINEDLYYIASIDYVEIIVTYTPSTPSTIIPQIIFI